MIVKRLMILAGLSVLLIGCSTGRYSTEGMQAFYHSESSADLGARYLLGRGVPVDNDKAFYYFNQAALDGDPLAENEVAYMYATGKGTSRDPEKALNWYQKAAAKGLASAQYNLGLMYEAGLGTPPDRVLAQKWFQKSAEHGFEPAQLALARYR